MALTALLLASMAASGQEVVPPVLPSEVAERLGPPYYSGAILPTPRAAKYRDDTMELIDGPGGEWSCQVVIDPDVRVRPLMERLLDTRLRSYTDQFPALADAAAADLPMARFSLAERDARGGPPERQEYSLEIRPNGATCLARDGSGLVNGLASFLQLVHVREGKLVVRCASVTDWPTFTTRYTSEYWLPSSEFFDWMAQYKINGFAACYPGMRWEGNSEEKRAGLKAIGDYIDAYGTMSFLVEFHIGGRGGCRPLDGGSEADVARLLETIRETMQLSHAAHVMICYDDVRPELQPEEAKRWQRPCQAHEYVMGRVYELVKGIDPNAVVSFCSPYYQGRHHRRWRAENPQLEETLQYMADLRAWKNRDIRIVWTGPVTESRLIVQEDIDHYLGLVGEDRKLFYWDNTWHYHQPLRDFHAKYLPGFVDHCADRVSYVNINGVQPIGRFFSVTANDHYWNPEAFDSVRSRKHAVAQFMGAQAVPTTEAFYELRGEDYFVFFSRDVDLAAMEDVIKRIERTSLDAALAKYCRTVYEGIVEKRGAGQ